MPRNSALILTSCLSAALVAGVGWAASPAAYHAPRLSFGQPDLGDYWSNASLTPESRPASLGEKLVYSPQEAKALEQKAANEFTEGNEPTNPNEGAPKKGGEIQTNIRPEFAAAGGNVGGYNIGWLDPGNAIMRVGGQPR